VPQVEPSPTQARLTTTDPVERFFGYYPGVVSVVTAQHASERNVMAAGWHAALSVAPPLYGVAVAPERYTYDLIVSSGAFAVHFLPFEHARAIAASGTLSRRTGVDKFQELGLEWAPGEATGAPILQAAYVAYECRVTNRVPVGDHDWFVGEVLAVHHDPRAFDERMLQRADVSPGAVYYGRSTYERLGDGPRVAFDPREIRGENG